FGDGALYLEEFLPAARHVEVQIGGGGWGAVLALVERECSDQLRHHKNVEIAPCPSLSSEMRDRLARDASALAKALRYRNAGTFEFLVASGDGPSARGARHVFIEANPRLQVEHTVTEEVMGVDLVRIQLQIARGATLAEIGLDEGALRAPRGFAIEARVNCETIAPDGTARPSGGTLTAFELPSGHGVRTDTCGTVGYRTNPRFDSLLAKVIGRSTSARFADAVARTERALSELRIEGVRTNVSFLRRLLRHPDFVANRIHTRFVDDHVAELVPPEDDAGRGAAPGAPLAGALAGARVDRSDPLAVLAYGKGDASAVVADALSAEGLETAGNALAATGARADVEVPEGALAVRALLQATVVAVEVRAGEEVLAGQALVVLSAMKMEHVVEAPSAGVVRSVHVSAGDTVFEGHPLVVLETRDAGSADAAASGDVDLDRIRPDLGEVERRHEKTRDAARPDAVARRRKTGQRTARENVDDLCDPGSFVEYGSLVIAGQRQRRSLEDLIERTPGDGLVAGVGCVNGDLFGEERARCAVLSYDYTVLAGTQGFMNHRKKDRLFEIAERMRLPVVFFTEGGGGRPGDTDAPGVAGLDCMAFHLFGRLSGL